MPRYINMDSKNVELDGRAYGPYAELDITENRAAAAVAMGARLAMRGESEAQTMAALGNMVAAQAPEEQEQAPQPEGITANSVRAALPRIAECVDVYALSAWLDEEKQGQARGSVIAAIERRLSAVGSEGVE